MAKFWGRGELFRQNCHRKYVISTGKPMALPTFWAIDRTCSSKIDGVVAISKFGLFLTWWPSSMTYLFVNVTYWNCSPIPYVDRVWWWYVKAFMSYAWQNWQTNRQTDRQTDEGQSEIAYLPKFANMMLIVMVIVITEILYIILIFDCFENQ